MRFLIIIMAVFFVSYTTEAQNIKLKKTIKEIDSTLSVYKKLSSKEALTNHHKNLEKSTEISYTKGLLNSYRSLIWYHGYLNSNSYGLDSTMYYCHLFESKIAPLIDKKYNTLIGDYYIDKGAVLGDVFQLTEESLNSYLKAYPFIDKKDIIALTSYDISIGRTYMSKDEYGKALNILIKRLKDSALMKPKQKRILMGDIASCYSYSDEPRKSLEMNLEILIEEKKSNDLNGFWWTKNEICRNYYGLGMYQKALDSALVARRNLIKIKYTTGIDNNSDLLSEIYYDRNINKSIKYLEEALKGNEAYYIYSDFFAVQFRRLALLYEEKKDVQTALVLYKKSNTIYDSIRARKKDLLITYTDLSTKYFVEKDLNRSIASSNNMLKETNKKQQSYLLFTAISFFILLLIFIVFYFYKEYRKGEKEVEKLKTNEKILLEEQIKLRDNEIAATVIAFSERLFTLNQINEELKGEEFTNEEKILKTSKTITKLINSASNIATITEKISSKHPSLTILLKEKHPSLTAREIDYCLLTKLNLSIKETASVLNVSPGTVKVTRSKLKVKMKIPTGVAFKEYLNQICSFSEKP